MHHRPALSVLVAFLIVSIQAAIASPDRQTRRLEAACHQSLEGAALAAGVGRVYIDVDGELECMAGRLQLALEVAIERIEPVARARRLSCSARCWLDRPTSAIARVGHRDQIWPSPPGRIEEGWVVFIVAVPDLTEDWWWIAVGPPGRGNQVAIEVIAG